MVNSGTPEGIAVPAPDVTHTSLTLFDMEIVFDTRIRKYMKITLTKHETPTKQMGVKTDRTSF